MVQPTLTLLGAILLTSQALGAEDTLFKSASGHFSVQYPSSWQPLDQEPEALDIVNFPPDQRLRGVILPEGGARINVGRRPNNIANVENWIQADVLDSKMDSRHEVRTSSASNGCLRLIVVKWRWDAGGAPEVYFQETAYYCVAKTGFYRIRLTYWSDNASAQELDAVALKVARSLKAW